MSSSHRDDKTDVRAASTNLVYIIGTYPSLTTTFIDREIASLKRLGATVRVVSVRQPSGTLSPEQLDLRRGVLYLLPAPIWAVVRAQAHFALSRPQAYFGMLLYLITRHHTSVKSRFMTAAHFASGVYTAYLLDGYPCDHIHAHFMDRAATLAMVVSRLRAIPFSITAHANDIYLNPVLIPEKLSEAKFVATCTSYNLFHLSRFAPGDSANKLTRIYHGLEISKYQPIHRDTPNTPVLLAVGQLKEKKGFAFLLEACRILKDRGYIYKCEIVGDGPLRSQLEAQLRQLSLEDTVMLSGALPHQEVIRRYRQSHVFVLPCVVAGDGDRDGIPNVILEAMAMELPVVSTDHSGIPEVLEDGVNGLMVPPGDYVALADALAGLLEHRDLRKRMGERGREMVAKDFDADRNTRHLLSEFTRSL